MVLVAKERPGVYSDYDASGILWGAQAQNKIAVAALNGKAETGRVYTLSRLSDARAAFGAKGEMSALCALLLQNGASQICAAAVAENTAAAYEEAFSALCREEGVRAVVCDSTQGDILQKLCESAETASAQNRERVGVAACPESADLTEFASRFNSERMALLAQSPLSNEGEALPRPRLAAAVAAALFRESDPSQSRNGLIIKGFSGLSPALSEEGLDEYVSAGVCPLEKVGGNIELIRAVTSRTKTDGNPDKSFRELSTVLIIDDVLESVRAAMKSLLSGKNTPRTLFAVATQAALVLEEKKEQERVYSYAQPVVTRNAEDPAVCEVTLSFTVANPFNQIQITAHIAV